MEVLDKEFCLFINHKKIESRIVELASQISKDYEGKNPLFVVLLNGAFMFAADLIKNIPIPCQVSFVKISSYHGMESSGQIKEIFGLEENLTGREIIILDDIIDTGITMLNMISKLNTQKPSTIEVASLLLKPEAFNNQFHVKYVGFTIPNAFVVGYGLDYNGYGRNLKDIYHFKD